MIVKNEEVHLRNCLESAAGLFDEIIIADTGSFDSTKAIAAEFTDKIYDFEWIDDFGAARNFSFSKATGDYIMWLDADDVIPEETHNGILKLKAELTADTDVIRLPYHTGFSDGKPTFTFYRERILKNCESARWSGFIHEVISPFGNTVSMDLPIEHRKQVFEPNSIRNLRIYERHIAAGEILSPRDMFYYGRELYYHQQNHDAIDVFNKFITSQKGWIVNIIDACRLRAECYERLGDSYNAQKSLFETMMYDLPQAEACCDIGQRFLKQEKYRLAIYWYEIALGLEPNYSSGAFILPECYGYIPALQICLCYSRLGDEKTAFRYNEIAAGYKMTESITYNRKWFESIGITGEETA
jgi:glycosyltransferase involved in cell wall biosynthesis